MKKKLIGSLLFLVCTLMASVAMSEYDVSLQTTFWPVGPGESKDFFFHVRDEDGKPPWKVYFNVTFSVSPDDGTVTLSPTTVTTNENGAASTTLTIGDAPANTSYRVTATLENGQSDFAIAFIGDDITLYGPDRASAGDSVEFSARVSDQEGLSGTKGETVTFSVSPDDRDASLSPTSTTTDSNGDASTTLTLGPTASGRYTVTATREDGQSASRSIQVKRDPNLPYYSISMYTSSVSPLKRGESRTWTATVTPSFFDETPVPGLTVTFSVSPDDGNVSLNPTTATTDSNGQASTSLSVGSNASGSYSVTGTLDNGQYLSYRAIAVDTSGNPAQQQSQDQQPETQPGRQPQTETETATATTLESVSGNGGSALAGSTIASPFVARVLDQNGDAMAGVSVSFSVTPSGTVNPSSALTGSNGQAETRLALGSATGTYTITASVAGITQTVTFTAIATPPVRPLPIDPPQQLQPPPTATTLESVSGNGQSALASSAIGSPFVVRVLDQNGDAMAGVSVSFSVTPSGAVNPSSALTGSNGQAETRLTLGSTPGTYTVTARVSGITQTVTFTAIATAPVQPPDTQTDTAIATAPVQPPDTQTDTATATAPVQPPDTQTDTATATAPVQPPDTQQGALQGTGTETATGDTGTGTGTDPGAATTREPEPTPRPSQLSALGQISFSELMFTSKGGPRSLPQWIELYNNSDTATVNLSTWGLTIEARDADGTHRHAVITLQELIIPPNETALIVTSSGRRSEDIQDNRVYNFFNYHSDEFEQNEHQNMVLGQAGFFLKLADPDGDVSDTAGNIDGDRRTEDEALWEIPAGTTQDSKRTSLFRRYAKGTDNPLDGTDANNWRRAANFGRISDLPALAMSQYWGRSTDIGNPGYKGAGALPVELSSFRAVMKEIGTVLSWTTESELDNAGFNILRSVSKSGHFLKVNPRLIQGAGTTSEQTTYMWTDTTAKPDTVYFYQIEDISYTGKRTRFATIRMKGYVSAQGKLSTRWADLKNSMR